MIEWKPATEYPERHVWVLAYRPKPPDIALVVIPYSLVCRDSGRWINQFHYTVFGITHWAYINLPTTTSPAKE